MSLTSEEVEKIAKLSYLSFSDSEKQKLQTELTDILNYVDQIKTLAEKVEVDFNEDSDVVNRMRDDVADTLFINVNNEVKVQTVAGAEISPSKFLEQAPDREGNYIKVKSVLE